jgi:hypothetical protein
MGVSASTLLQSQLVELPTDLRQLQLRFTEKMLKAAIAQKALQSSIRSTERIDTYA